MRWDQRMDGWEVDITVGDGGKRGMGHVLSSTLIVSTVLAVLKSVG